MIHIVIVDDHELVRRGLRDLIESHDEFRIVAEAGNTFDGLNAIKTHQPDIAILDVRMLDGNGVELCREIQSQFPEVKVIMLTAYSDDEALLGSILAGAKGYLLKDIKGDIFLKSIHKVAQGESILDAQAAERVRDRLRKVGSPAAEIADLSEQERRIISLIGDGFSNFCPILHVACTEICGVKVTFCLGESKPVWHIGKSCDVYASYLQCRDMFPVGIDHRETFAHKFNIFTLFFVISS